VNLFVADEDVRFLQGLEPALPVGTTLSIIPAVAAADPARGAHSLDVRAPTGDVQGPVARPPLAWFAMSNSNHERANGYGSVSPRRTSPKCRKLIAFDEQPPALENGMNQLVDAVER